METSAVIFLRHFKRGKKEQISQLTADHSSSNPKGATKMNINVVDFKWANTFFNYIDILSESYKTAKYFPKASRREVYKQIFKKLIESLAVDEIVISDFGISIPSDLIGVHD